MATTVDICNDEGGLKTLPRDDDIQERTLPRNDETEVKPLPLEDKIDDETLPRDEIEKETLPCNEIEEETLPREGEGEAGTLPFDEAESEAGTLPLDEAESGTLPLDEVVAGTLPLDEAGAGTLPLDKGFNSPDETEHRPEEMNFQRLETASQHSVDFEVQLELDEQYARVLQAQFIEETAAADPQGAGHRNDVVEDDYYSSEYEDLVDDVNGEDGNGRNGNADASRADNPPAPSGQSQPQPVAPRQAANARQAQAMNRVGGVREYVVNGLRVLTVGSEVRGIYILPRRPRSPIRGLNYAYDDDEDTDDEEMMPRGLMKSEINRLPTRVFNSDERAKLSNSNSDENDRDTSSSANKYECMVCASDYEDGEKLRILPCFHEFHSKCVDRWLQNKSTCPFCRTAVNFEF